jgi:DNA-directed RNA polymerase specialized sigma24 family protein
MASRAHPLPGALPARLPLVRARDGVLRLVRTPGQRGAWSPEEVAHVLNGRREEFFGVLSRRRDGAIVSSALRQEVVDEAISLVVMSRKPIQNEQHLEGAFWTAVRLLLAEHRSGRHSVRVGSRQRVDLELVGDQLPAGTEPSEIVEAREQIARAADFMAQLDPFEQQVVTLMATRGIGVKLAARRLGVPTKTVVAATRSADHKLEQIAVIAAAGRMCAYRHPAILAHAHGEASAQREQAAKAHLAACAGCRSAYLEMKREMRQRDYQRRASAAFLPPVTIAGHVGLLDRIAGLVAHHRLPSSPASGERAAGLLGGGGVAAKAAVAGTAILVAGAGVVSLTAGAHHKPPHRPHRAARGHIQITRPTTTSIAHTLPATIPSRSRVTAAARPAAHHPRAPIAHMSTATRAAVKNFPALGGNSPTPSPVDRAETDPPPATNERERILKTP